MDIKNNILFFQRAASAHGAKLVAVTKTQPIAHLQDAYDAGQRIFGENKVQELVSKQEALPSDIAWHMIGHLQTNKVKYIASFISLIHSVDSLSLIAEIDRQGKKCARVIECLLQIHIAAEETKFGFSEAEALSAIREMPKFSFVKIKGVMGMASMTTNEDQIRTEFSSIKNLFEKIENSALSANVEMKEMSIGMSSDYQIALEQGSTMIRVGSSIFGERIYNT